MAVNSALTASGVEAVGLISLILAVASDLQAPGGCACWQVLTLWRVCH